MDAEELYGLPLGRFVPERNALARELRAAGRRDQAAAIAALRKPSAAARGVNQLARSNRRQLGELFAAGDALSDAQSNVLAGRADGRSLSEAAERERAAVSGLVDIARTLLAAEGLTVSAAVLERIAETLHAAALDDDARQSVNGGRLERELRHVGLGMGDDVAAPAKPPAAAPRRRAGADGETAAGKAAEARERAAANEQAAANERAEARKRATTAEAEARRRATRAAKAVDAADRRRSRAAEALAQAEEALRAARQAAKAAEMAHGKTTRELRRLA